MSTTAVGRGGEARAQAYLEERGYKLLRRNYRNGPERDRSDHAGWLHGRVCRGQIPIYDGLRHAGRVCYPRQAQVADDCRRGISC